MQGFVLEDWYQEFSCAKITIHNVKTGEQLQEPSLVAARFKIVQQTGRSPSTGETTTVVHKVLERYIAAGEEARAYENCADVMVFSPFRDGQVAQYDGAIYLLGALLERILPKVRIMKPVLCLKVQERTTQVEERAVVDLGIQAGARNVLLYQESLSVLLDSAQNMKDLRNAIIVDIQPLR